MAQASSDLVALRYVAESAWGTTPVTPAMQEVRFTGESLQTNTGSAQSNEIRSDRQISDIVRTSRQTGGDVNVELSYGSYDAWLLAALLCDVAWTTPVTNTGTDIDAANADNSFNDASAGFGSFVVGEWVRVRGFANAANNGYFKIATKAVGKITVTGGTLVTEAATPSVTIKMGASIKNGVTPVSYTLEREYVDIDQFAIFRGMLPTGFSLDVKAGSIITGAFTFVGKSETSAAATVATSSADPAETHVMNGIDHVINVVDNSIGIDAMAFGLKLSNGFRPQPELKSLDPIGYGMGRMVVEGTLQLYFENATMVDKYLNWTDSSLAIALQDEDGNGYVFECPKVRYTAGPRTAGGKDQDIVVDLAWQAFKDPTEETTIRITRIGA